MSLSAMDVAPCDGDRAVSFHSKGPTARRKMRWKKMLPFHPVNTEGEERRERRP